REPLPEKLQKVRQSPRFGAVIMRPESLGLAVEPDAVEIFEAAFVMRIALDIVEKIARLRRGQKIKALAGFGLAQLEGRRPGLAGVLQARLRHQSRPGGLGHAADRMIEPGQPLHGGDTSRLEFLDLGPGNIGDVEQAVLGLPLAFAVIAPAAKPTIGTWDRPGRRWIFQESLEPLTRHARISLIVREP